MFKFGAHVVPVVGPLGASIYPKGPKRTQKDPKGTRKDPKGPKRNPKGTQKDMIINQNYIIVRISGENKYLGIF